ncbi:glutamate--cysteine ligase [Bartonella tamiae]|uniref:Glutamate--cysteine ligase n=1 Tax=Bartonella tamiae Th239 TaxID=1094558 RepID=J0ZLS4_9HYPH|nr:glutamate--cysteine ligase [Bartonella tamiae]EJF89378.1 glutamate-cysteine ligase [Bartonella tamiae Th239]EJF92757.1 glutamate-cysteine ligase [Bartonella tamiae Th307]
MARDTVDDTLINKFDDLVHYLAEGEKPETQWRIGTEHEKFPFLVDGYQPVPYDGEKSIYALLKGMQSRLGWEPIMDEDNLIGLSEPNGQGAISLEPGGQFELSGAPLQTVHQTCYEVQNHFSHLKHVAEPLKISFLGVGGSPKWRLNETPKMPKSRYAIMTNYMPKVGQYGLDMMYRTSTIQVNLDFASESDMRTKMQVAMKLQSLATALFASSPFTEAKPNGFISWRSQIWSDTDNQRSGILPFVFHENFGFADYANWALDVPMYFVVRNGHYHDCTHITFRQFMNGALKHDIAGIIPNLGDWVNHLSTLFPEVRLKRFLEMRGADGGSFDHICALPAFWVGLLYDKDTLAQIETMTKDWQYDEVQSMRQSVPRFGLNTKFRNMTLMDLAREVIPLAQTGLKNRQYTDAEGRDETQYLAPLEEFLNKGKTKSDLLLERYRTDWNQSIEPIFQEESYW